MQALVKLTIMNLTITTIIGQVLRCELWVWVRVLGAIANTDTDANTDDEANTGINPSDLPIQHAHRYAMVSHAKAPLAPCF